MGRAGWREDGLLALIMVIWGLNPVLIKIGLREIDPFALIMLRTVAGLVILVGLFAVLERKWPSWPRGFLTRLLLIGVIGVSLNQILFNLSLSYTSVANNSVIGSSTPIFGLIFARMFEGERSSRRRWFGAALGLAGVAVMVRGQGEFSFGAQSFLGDLMILGATVALTLQAMMGKPLLKSMSSLEVTLYSMVIGVPLMLPATAGAMAAQSWTTISPLAWLVTIGSGVIIMVVIVVMYRVVATAGASKFLLFMYLTPVSGVIAGMVVLHEPISMLQIIGAAAVLWGVYEARENEVAVTPVKSGASASA